MELCGPKLVVSASSLSWVPGEGHHCLFVTFLALGMVAWDWSFSNEVPFARGAMGCLGRDRIFGADVDFLCHSEGEDKPKEKLKKTGECS